MHRPQPVRRIAVSSAILVLASLCAMAAPAPQAPGPAAAPYLTSPPAPLPMARQIAVRETWLPRRYEMLLRMMRARKVGMWMVVNEELLDTRTPDEMPHYALLVEWTEYLGHRVVPGHVIQAGMAAAGSTAPGYQFPNEIVPALSHGKAGMLGMANAGPHTNTAQFYITLGDRSYLDGNYTLFGEVVSGMDVVNATVQGDWIDHVRIVRVGERARTFKADTTTFRAMVEAAEARVKAADDKKAREEAAIIARKWPGAKPSPRGALVMVTREGQGEPAAK